MLPICKVILVRDYPSFIECIEQANSLGRLYQMEAALLSLEPDSSFYILKTHCVIEKGRLSSLHRAGQ